MSDQHIIISPSLRTRDLRVPMTGAEAAAVHRAARIAVDSDQTAEWFHDDRQALSRALRKIELMLSAHGVPDWREE